jgi:phosphatidate cytidylyltransferase
LSGRIPELLTRILSAAVLIPVLLFCMYQGGWWFFAFITVLMTLATWEYVRMLHRLDYHAQHVFAVALVWVVLADSLFPTRGYLRPGVALLLVGSLCWHILRDRSGTTVENWLLPLAGALYIGWSAGHMLLLRALPQGAYRVFTVVCTMALADTGAFFVGRSLGKHRMAPRLSPKKTWEGMVGGIVLGAITGSVLTSLGGQGWVHGLVLGLLLSTLGPMGDLGESMIKRRAGVKDSSNLIPGHGGAFDRVDSMLVAGVIGYYYMVWVMGVVPVG